MNLEVSRLLVTLSASRLAASSLVALSETLRKFLKQPTKLLRAELDAVAAHARASDESVMKIPRRRNAGGLSRSASLRKIPGTPGYHRATVEAVEVHSGTTQPSRSARYSANEAKAASISVDRVDAGSRPNTRCASSTPPRFSAEVLVRLSQRSRKQRGDA